MAERAGGRKTKPKSKGKKGAKPNGAGNGLGHNSAGQVPDEVKLRHYDTIGVALKASKAADDVAKKKRSALQNAYKAAKGDGCDVDAMKETRKLDEGDHTNAILHFKEVGDMLELIESELPLFRAINIPPPVNAFLAGRQAGREGAPNDNPHQPGSEEFVRWAEGHAEGVDVAVAGLSSGQPVA